MSTIPLLLASILELFGIAPSAYIAQGGESYIYQLDDARILRIQKEQDERHEKRLTHLKSFYDALKNKPLPFSIPEIDSIGMHNNLCYSIERFIPGTNLTAYITQATDEELYTVLKNYFNAAAQMHTLQHNLGNYFGELFDSFWIFTHNIRAESWPEFLLARADEALRKSYDSLRTDVNNFDALIAAWKAQVRKLHVLDNALVHGDFHPGNVMVDAHGQVVAVIDFSPLTVLGDWRMDIAGAYMSLDYAGSHISPAYKEKLCALGRKIVHEKFGDIIDEELITLYHTYYAIYYAAFKEEDEATYQWCVNYFNNKKLP